MKAGNIIIRSKDVDNVSHYTYCDALRSVLAVRAQRQKVYADDWKDQADWELLALIKLKVARLQHFVIDRKDEELYENRIDTLVDLVNYSLFLLQNEIDKKQR